MNALQLLPVFVVGLAGSVHCAGMCGGIVGALSATTRPAVIPTHVGIHRARDEMLSMDSRVRGNDEVAVIPITVAAAGALPHVLAYNAGRIASYMLAGALAGGLAGGALNLAPLAGAQLGFYWLANLMLVALGLYLMNAWRGLAVLEQGGRVLWRHAQPAIAPMMKTLVPADQPYKAFALGALWGWLPCGMVYSTLATAMLSGSAADGAAVMLAFGLGTLPMLTGLGLLGARVQRAMQKRHVRIACGLLVLAFGVIGVARAAGGVTPDWMNMLCLTPHP
jgi:sulfite exporter TauE/SafE